MARTSSDRHPFDAQPPKQVQLSSTSREIVERLGDFYGFEITIPAEQFEVPTAHGQHISTIEGQAASSNSANSFLPLFQDEFGLYPRSLVKSARLSRVVLCGEVSLSRRHNSNWKGRGTSRFEGDIPPRQFEHAPTGGVADKGGFYLSIEAVNGHPEALRHAIHHEFYHCIQREQFAGRGDPEWEATNSPDFVYGPGGAATLDSECGFWSEPTEDWGHGFLNLYCMAAPEEDQAEVFASLITEPHQLHERVTVDDILLAKVERLKDTLSQFCGDMDARFWERVRDSRLPFDL